MHRTGKLFFLFCTSLLLFTSAFAQTSAEANGESPIQNHKMEKATRLFPEMHAKGITDRKTNFITKKLTQFQERVLRRRDDVDRAWTFFLVALGASVLCWVLYLAIYFATLDATTGILLSMLGPLTILAILASLAFLMSVVILLVALSGSRY